MKTSDELFSWLETAVPAMVLQYIIQSQALKVCSNISPAFAVVARYYDFDAYQVTGNNHFYNVVLTSDGPVEVDLSYIQFSVCGYRDSIRKAIKDLVKDPWMAVRVRAYEEDLNELEEPRMRSDAVDATLRGYQQSLNDILGFKLSDPDVIEDYEDLYPWFSINDWQTESDPGMILDN